MVLWIDFYDDKGRVEMKRIMALLLALLHLSACAATPVSEKAEAPERVISLHGSYAQAWLLAGGTLIGTSEDAINERNIDLDESVSIIGTTKNPNMELIIELEPDLVFYSLDTQAQMDAAKKLTEMGVRCQGYSVTTYQEYLEMMKSMCEITNRSDLYENQLKMLDEPIKNMLKTAQADEQFGIRTALFLRAFSTDVKAKGSDASTVTGPILSDMGFINIADADDSLLENLTMEAIVEADPDYIFVVTMGSDDEKAMEMLATTLSENPAWSGLAAVKEDRFIMLDKALFHYKPNNRWVESYAFIYELLYESES